MSNPASILFTEASAATSAWPDAAHDGATWADGVAEVAGMLQRSGMPGLAARAIAGMTAPGASASSLATAARLADGIAGGIAADAAGIAFVASPGDVVIPSAQRHADGAPRFLLAIPADTLLPGELLDAVREELDAGTEVELRALLDALLEPGDVFLDADPGFGFAVLTAATVRHRGAGVVTRAADAAHATYLEGNLARNGLAKAAAVMAPGFAGPATLDQMARHPLVAGARRLVVHVGHARDLHETEMAGGALWSDPRLAAVAVTTSGVDGAATGWLARRGLEVFAVAQDADGTVLVPAASQPGAALLVGIGREIGGGA